MKMNCELPSLDFRIFLRSAQVEDALELYKVKKVTCSLSQGVCLLTQSQTSTSSPRARPPPPVRSPPTSSPRARPPPPVRSPPERVIALVSASSPRARPPPPDPEPDLHLLTPSQTSTSSPRARPPPPVRSPPEQLKGEAERLGTGGLWCQDGPETEAGDQGPAAPDQRMQVVGCVASLGDLLNKTSAVCSRPGICEESCCIPQRVSGAAASWPCLVEELVEVLPGICLRRAAVFPNVFLERRGADRGAVNLEDDHHSTNKDPLHLRLVLQKTC
ncbi:unnamed protein product [Boreogadus saida]